MVRTPGTGAGRAVLFLVGLAVLGYVGWTYRAQITDRLRVSTQGVPVA